MYWNKNKKKYIAIIFGGILILVILCLGDYGIRYYNAPIEKDYKYIGTGMLVRLSDFTNGELVSVEMRGKTAHYLQTILCGVTIDEEEFLLVTPAEDGTTANNMIKAAEKQSQAFSQWLSNARRGITD